MSAPLDHGLTDDAFLGGRVRIWQPKQGYRAATDPVLLAAACPVAPGERVLDVGCGVGTAALCLAARVPDLALFGVDAEPAFLALSEKNAARNSVAWRVFQSDVRDPSAELKAMCFDHVITNPPFYDAAKNPENGHPLREAAHREAASIGAWFDFCLRRLRPKGWLTLIHRAERLPEILTALEGRAGAISVLPLQPRPGRDAKRVILRARKEARAPFRMAAAFTLHPAEGEGFVEAATAILRDGAPLDF